MKNILRGERAPRVVMTPLLRRGRAITMHCFTKYDMELICLNVITGKRVERIINFKRAADLGHRFCGTKAARASARPWARRST